MKPTEEPLAEALEQRVERLLADAAHAGHPLRQALGDLYDEFRDALTQIERVTRISDRYQSISQQEKLTLAERYRKQIRQLERLSRISDRYQAMMRDLNEALKEASTKDALTGIGNRRLLMESLKAETARADRLERPFTLVMVDVDRFKAVNDQYGHDAGDKVLIEVARVIESGIREYDVCGRWGGEEFLVIMPEIDAVEAAAVIERIRAAINALKVLYGERQIGITASFGIAEHARGESISDFLNRADMALYAAKRAGRNRLDIAAA
ncbi:biofilm regulation diguanylate cyclase SiaD [Noviherbaspirillum galbum]|uniref:diguanylate cyclase n=1 Tax=Noviherbaspirillum galbum TaxID=2709383 RepID=A0A6B3SYH9_9BURK|nr:biofilm regulation diguanylate cyclase SiaD [Noviherbaspirillum galbum]NEX63782.1 GGDEF domain-containing protein [Noviherbaspirillum galbum]